MEREKKKYLGWCASLLNSLLSDGHHAAWNITAASIFRGGSCCSDKAKKIIPEGRKRARASKFMCVVYCSFTTLIVVLLKMLGIIQEGRLITRIPTAVNQRWLFLGTKRSYKTKGNQLAWLLNTNYSLMINKAALVIFPFFSYRYVQLDQDNGKHKKDGTCYSDWPRANSSDNNQFT